MHIPRVLKAGAALTGIAAAAGTVAYALSRRPYLREVAPGLRSPVLYLPMHVLPDATFARASRFFATIDFSRPIRHAVDITEFSASFDGHAFSPAYLPHATRPKEQPLMVRAPWWCGRTAAAISSVVRPCMTRRMLAWRPSWAPSW